MTMTADVECAILHNRDGGLCFRPAQLAQDTVTDFAGILQVSPRSLRACCCAAAQPSHIYEHVTFPIRHIPVLFLGSCNTWYRQLASSRGLSMP